MPVVGGFRCLELRLYGRTCSQPIRSQYFIWTNERSPLYREDESCVRGCQVEGLEEVRLQARRVPLPGQAGTHDGCAGDGNSGGGENLPPGHVPGQGAVRLVNRILVLLTRLLQSGSEIIMLLRQLKTQLKAPEGISCLQLCLYGMKCSFRAWEPPICHKDRAKRRRRYCFHGIRDLSSAINQSLTPTGPV